MTSIYFIFFLGKIFHFHIIISLEYVVKCVCTSIKFDNTVHKFMMSTVLCTPAPLKNNNYILKLHKKNLRLLFLYKLQISIKNYESLKVF